MHGLNNCELRLRLRLQRCCSGRVRSWDCCRLMESGSRTDRRYDLNNCGLWRRRLRLQRCCSARVSSWDCCRLRKSGSRTDRGDGRLYSIISPTSTSTSSSSCYGRYAIRTTSTSTSTSTTTTTRISIRLLSSCFVLFTIIKRS